MAMFNQNSSFAGLGTFTFVADIASPYFFEGKISLPTIVNGGGASAVVTTINLNASPVYVGLAGAEGFKKDLNLAVGDVVTIVFSSAAAADQGINNVKATIAIGQGV